MKLQFSWTMLAVVLLLSFTGSARVLAQSPGPATVIAVAGTGTSPVITWSLAPGAVTYTLTRENETTGVWTTLTSTLTASSEAGTIAPAYQDSGLTAGTEYLYQMYYFSTTGSYSMPSNVVGYPNAAPPGAPLCSVGGTGTSPIVTWSTVPGATKYQVWRYNETKAAWTELSSTLTASSTVGKIAPAYQDSGVSQGTEYYYGVYGVNSNGVIGTFSNEPLYIPSNAARLATPTIIGGYGYNGYINGNLAESYPYTVCNWNTVPGATGYLVLRSQAGPNDSQLLPLLTVSFDGDSYTATDPYTSFGDDTVNYATTYTYLVYAVDVNGAGLPATVTITVPAQSAPSTPPGLTTVAGNGSVTLNWNAVANATGYSVNTTTTSGYSNTQTTTGTSFTVTGLTNGQLYTFNVSAIGAAGTSAPASVSAIDQVVPPSTPTGLAAVVEGNGGINLNWNAETNTTSYSVNITTNGSTSTQSTTSTSLTVVGQTNGQLFTFNVSAVGPGGTSAPASVSANASIPIASQPPNTPTDLIAVIGDGSITVNWDSMTGASGYNITTTSINGYSYTQYTNSPSYTLSGLTDGQSYTFNVSAEGSGGTSTAASISAVPNRILSSPTLLATAAGIPFYAAVQLSLSSVTGANAYNIYQSTSSTGANPTLIGSTSGAFPDTICGEQLDVAGQPTTVSNLVVGQTYYFYVRPTYEAETGPPSNIVSYTAAISPATINMWAAPIQPATNNILVDLDTPQGSTYNVGTTWTLIKTFPALASSPNPAATLKWDMFCGLPNYCTAKVDQFNSSGQLILETWPGNVEQYLDSAFANNYYGEVLCYDFPPGGYVQLWALATSNNVPVTFYTCQLDN